MKFFTSDTHFGHAKIIEYCHRPFDDEAHMDAELVRRWNSIVRPDDEVYILGDVSFRNQIDTRNLLLALNGKKYLVRGNHDSAFRLSEGPDGPLLWVKDYHEIRVDKELIVMSHFPFMSWNMMNRGAIHLHGHTHGRVENTGLRRLDVGVDCWAYAPVSVIEILEIMKNIEFQNIQVDCGHGGFQSIYLTAEDATQCTDCANKIRFKRKESSV